MTLPCRTSSLDSVTLTTQQDPRNTSLHVTSVSLFVGEVQGEAKSSREPPLSTGDTCEGPQKTVNSGTCLGVSHPQKPACCLLLLSRPPSASRPPENASPTDLPRPSPVPTCLPCFRGGSQAVPTHAWNVPAQVCLPRGPRGWRLKGGREPRAQLAGLLPSPEILRRFRGCHRHALP